jgi:acetylornithine deacetylase/succinyl-diaminopimelate desuccinylase-like protein
MRRFLSCPAVAVSIVPKSTLVPAPLWLGALLTCQPCLSAPAAPAAAAPETVASQLRDAALAGHDIAYGWLSELTTRFGPRPAGSPNEQAAAEWAVSRLKALGFENVHLESFPLAAWVRGNESAQLVAPSRQPLVAAALGESPPTPAGGIEADVVLFPTLAELQAVAPGSLAGRIALVTLRMVRTQDGAGYGPAVAARIDGPAAAARAGASAFLMRSAGTGPGRFAHTGTTAFVEGRVPVPAFALSNPDADQLERIAALGQTPRVQLTSSASYLSGAHSQNVVADIRGSAKSEQFVLLGAHLDSWDQGTGAVDDGAGTAIIVAAAKLIRDLPHKPQRTVRVVLFGAEEPAQPAAPGSVFGGHAYADTHRGELPRHVLASESDLGADRIYSLALPHAVLKGEFADTVQRVLGPLGILAEHNPTHDAGADVAPSVEGGVPSFALNQDATRYFDLHHTADDTLDKVERTQLDQNVAAWAALVWLAADTTQNFREPAAP